MICPILHTPGILHESTHPPKDPTEEVRPQSSFNRRGNGVSEGSLAFPRSSDTLVHQLESLGKRQLWDSQGGPGQFSTMLQISAFGSSEKATRLLALSLPS